MARDRRSIVAGELVGVRDVFGLGAGSVYL
jgi:hypothetical protein